MKRSTLAAVLGNVISLLALALVNFGVELDAATQAEIVSALLLIVNTCALIIPAVVATVNKSRAAGSSQAGRSTPAYLAAVASRTLIVAALSACATQPQNAREALALGYTAHTATVRAVTAATTSEAITVDQAQQARSALQLAREQLDVARALVEADQSAVAPLQRVTQLLTAVEPILQEGAQ